MTEQQRIDGNKKIAQLAGLVYSLDKEFFITTTSFMPLPAVKIDFWELKFHESWDWLIFSVKSAKEVLRNIEKEENSASETLRQARMRFKAINHELTNLNIHGTWYCLVQFITWYNTQSTQHG